MLFQSPPIYFKRHLDRYLIEQGKGVAILKQVEDLIQFLDDGAKETPSMAERARQLLEQTKPIKQSPKKTNQTVNKTLQQVPSAAAAAEEEEEGIATVTEQGPSLGFLLALKRMLPSLERLFKKS